MLLSCGVLRYYYTTSFFHQLVLSFQRSKMEQFRQSRTIEISRSTYFAEYVRVAREIYTPSMGVLRINLQNYDERSLMTFVRLFNYQVSHILAPKPRSNNIFWHWDKKGKSGEGEKIKKKPADEIPCLNETWYNEEEEKEEEEEEEEEGEDGREQIERLISHVLDLVPLD